MVYTKSQVKKSMDSKRKRFLKEADTPKKVNFGNDKMVLEFATGYYYDQYKAWMHNYVGLSEVSYDDYFYMFTYKSDYEDMMNVLKEDYSGTKDASVKKLIDMAKVIRKRYGGR